MEIDSESKRKEALEEGQKEGMNFEEEEMLETMTMCTVQMDQK